LKCAWLEHFHDTAIASVQNVYHQPLTIVEDHVDRPGCSSYLELTAGGTQRTCSKLYRIHIIDLASGTSDCASEVFSQVERDTFTLLSADLDVISKQVP
jgi:hypothetical protein